LESLIFLRDRGSHVSVYRGAGNGRVYSDSTQIPIALAIVSATTALERIRY